MRSQHGRSAWANCTDQQCPYQQQAKIAPGLSRLRQPTDYLGSCTQVTELLQQSAPKRPAAIEANGHAAEAGSAAQDLPNGEASSAPAPGAPPAAQNGAAAHAEDMETDGAAPSVQAAPAPSLKPEEERYLERFGRLRGILDGTMSISHYLEFLYSHNHADLQVRSLPSQRIGWRGLLSCCEESFGTISSHFMWYVVNCLDDLLEGQKQRCAALLRIDWC